MLISKKPESCWLAMSAAYKGLPGQVAGGGRACHRGSPRPAGSGRRGRLCGCGGRRALGRGPAGAGGRCSAPLPLRARTCFPFAGRRSPAARAGGRRLHFRAAMAGPARRPARPGAAARGPGPTCAVTARGWGARRGVGGAPARARGLRPGPAGPRGSESHPPRAASPPGPAPTRPWGRGADVSLGARPSASLQGGLDDEATAAPALPPPGSRAACRPPCNAVVLRGASDPDRSGGGLGWGVPGSTGDLLPGPRVSQ